MNKDELEKVQEFIRLQSFSAELEDFNEDSYNFNAGCVQVNVISKDELGFCYQTSCTSDLCAMSSQISINNQSGASYELSSMLKQFGFNEDFIEENVWEVGEIIGRKLKVQKIFDDYMDKRGEWERSTMGLDANSETFVSN